MIKIIYIISFCPKYEYDNSVKPDHTWRNNRNEEIAIWRIDWGHIFARDLKRFFPEIEFEVWRPDYRAEKEYVHVFEDGVVHRSFPAQKVKFRVGIKPTYFASSKELIEKFESLVEQQRENRNLVCHMPLDFSYLGHIMLIKFRKQVPFLHTSHLNPQLLNIDLKTANPLKFLHRLFLKRTNDKQKRMLGDIAVTLDRIEFFKTHTKSNVYQFNSLNFDFEWAKDKISKEEARKKLRLDPNIFILFSSSRLVPEKQLDRMIQSLAALKEHKFLCIISGSGELQYQGELKALVHTLNLDEHIAFVGYLSDELMDYYCASDVFITASVSEGGPVSAIKAMALDIPVITTNTGIVYSLLKEANAGVILDKNDTSEWSKQIEKVLLGEKIKIINSLKLEEDYELKKSIEQLVGYYYKAIENFEAGKSSRNHINK